MSEGDNCCVPFKSDVLYKWINFLYGWQERYFVLCDGYLSYYKSPEDLDSCRGSICLKFASITIHPLDNLRIEILVPQKNEEVISMHLRCFTIEQMEDWLKHLELHRQITSLRFSSALDNLKNEPVYVEGPMESKAAFVPSCHHKRCLSEGSETSALSSWALSISYQAQEKQLLNFLSDATRRQAILLQSLTRLAGLLPADSSAHIIPGLVELENTVKAVYQSLSECADIVKLQSEEHNKRLALRRNRQNVLEKLKKQVELAQSHASIPPMHEIKEETTPVSDEKCRQKLSFPSEPAKVGGTNYARYESTIEACVQNILSIAEDATDLDNTWEPIEITEHHRLYRRDILSTTPDGKKSIDDSLIAFATIKGITAGELCFFFFDLKTRWKWEAIMENCKVLEDLGSNTLILNQSYVRVWPANQRDCTFLSHFRKWDDQRAACVINVSVSDHQADILPPGFVRATCNTGMYCRTVVLEHAARKPADQLTRNDVAAEMVYTGKVSPGGWIPCSAVRAASRREYPKFITRLAKACQDHVNANHIPLILKNL